MMDPDKYKHDRSRYERPTYPWRCGRGADWDKPCSSGPNPDGSCGGTSESAPATVGDRHECRRVAINGGPCTNGPLPDGSCSQQRPPCRPRRSLRRIRGLVSLFSAGAVIAIIALLLTISSDQGSATLIPLSPGPLTDQHAKFTGDLGCVACHESHGDIEGGWFDAALHDNDLTGQCLDCHTFGGPARLAHNTTFENGRDLGEFACVSCHTEHQGRDAEITGLTDTQCNSCHKVSVRSFAGNHPEFPGDFPHERRNSIQFDHVNHIGVHFTDARYTERAPASCTDCHAAEAAMAAVEPAGFAQNCVACHGEVMSSKPMVVLSLPELTEYGYDVDEIQELCGPIEDMDSIEEYETISYDEMTPIGAYLLGVPLDDADEYGEAMQELVLAMAENGASPLAELLEERTDNGAALLAGLNPEVVKRTACAWASNLEYESPEEAEFGGWYGDYLELSYRPQGHADPVARAWIDFSIAAVAEAEDDEDYERAQEVRWQLLDAKTGVGACMKCHAVSQTGEDEDALAVEWTYHEGEAASHTIYAHGPHLSILSAEGADLAASETGCQTCHKFNVEAPYREAFQDSDPHHFESNFLPITKETCASCHAKGEVRQECQLCHVYHTKPGFKLTESQE